MHVTSAHANRRPSCLTAGELIGKGGKRFGIRYNQLNLVASDLFLFTEENLNLYLGISTLLVASSCVLCAEFRI